MLPTNRITAHPGELVREILNELGVSRTTAAGHCRMTVQRLTAIIDGKRGISAETAWAFSQAFGTSPEYWMNLQAQHDLTKARPKVKLPLLRAS